MEAKQSSIAVSEQTGLGLLDQIMAQTKLEPDQEGYSVARKGVAEFISEMLRTRDREEPVNKRLVDQMVAELDHKISQQMDAILHHPQVQQLESSWRGLKLLVDRTDFRENIRVEIIHITKDELLEDFEGAADVTQSGFYKHVYAAGYGQFGGQPVAAVVGNYYFGPSTPDVKLLNYTADYIATWRQALNSLHVTEFRDLDHGVDVLESVTGASEPLRRLVEAVRANTTLYEPITAGSKAAVAAAEAKLMDDPDRQDARRIEREFAPMANLLAAKGDRPSYLDETNKTLGALHDALKAVQNSPDRGQAALNAVVGRLRLEGTDSIFTLQRVASGLPEPLNEQVGTIASESARVLMLEAMTELERRWDRDVHGFYRERLEGRYPLNPASRQDVALEDFEAFFGPQGRLQQFYGQYLKLFLEDPTLSTSAGRAWVNPQVIKQLQAAQRIRDAFFGSQGGMGLQFNVQPLALSSNDRNSVLNVDGQLVSYSHGPSTPTGLIWPNTLRAGMESKVTVVDGIGNSRALRFSGPWAWFRLLSQSQLNGATAQSVDLSFAVGDGRVRYRISADKSVNPFTQRLFQDFALPRTLRPDAPATPLAEAAGAPAPQAGGTQ